jgi:fatty acid desaturase
MNDTTQPARCDALRSDEAATELVIGPASRRTVIAGAGITALGVALTAGWVPGTHITIV